MGFWTFAVLLLFIAVMIWRIVRRGYQMKDLVERGKPITGEVVNKVKFRGTSSVRNRYLRYRFRAGDGQYYSHKIAIGSDDFARYEPGQPIELVYLPDNPKVSAASTMVELTREAMRKQAAKKANESRESG
jgi:hypothetical protein